MPQIETTFEQDEYRLVLVKSGSQVLWVDNIGDIFRLPRTKIQRWKRPAEQLQQAIGSSWGFRCIILDILPGEKGSGPCAIVETLSSRSQTSFATTGLDEIDREELTSEERNTVNAIITGGREPHGPFSRMGWIAEALDWVRAAVGRKVTFTGEVHQYNASACFALVRFATQEGPAYWLKATGEPNTHEFRITKMLSELCPEYLPRRIGERKDWNAWLMEDAGQSVSIWTLPTLEKAVSSMGKLQVMTIGRTGAFQEAGASNLPLSALRAHIGELFEYLDDAMMRQSSTKVPRIEKPRLLELAGVVHDACFRMEALEIPDTLVHNDMNSGNILFEGMDCVFTDWCEAGIGNPFLTLQYLCLLDSHGENGWTARLRETYKQCWLDRLTSFQIDRAFALMPLLAIVSHLYGPGTWLHSARRNDPRFEGYARSLARYMDRAAQNLRLMEVLCR